MEKKKGEGAGGVNCVKNEDVVRQVALRCRSSRCPRSLTECRASLDHIAQASSVLCAACTLRDKVKAQAQGAPSMSRRRKTAKPGPW